jgi:hypothetical protein
VIIIMIVMTVFFDSVVLIFIIAMVFLRLEFEWIEFLVPPFILIRFPLISPLTFILLSYDSLFLCIYYIFINFAINVH